MKDSGIAWLKYIPHNWNVERGKNILNLQKRPVRDTDEVITCFRDGEVVLRSERRTDGFTMSDKEIGYQGINEGDIVIHGMDGFAGAMGISKSTGKGSPVLIVCTPKYDAIPKYLIYYLRTLAMTDVFIALATGIRERSCDLRWNKISDLEFVLPSSDEQRFIANFLDEKCGEIDELVALQEKMIDELKAYKQSVITETVTKGLDKNVKMKDSGVEWIGEIPEHWETSSLSSISNSMRNGYVGPTRDLFVDEGIPYIQSLHIKDGEIDFDKHRYYVRKEWADQKPKVHTGNLLVVQTGDIGQVAIVPNNCGGWNCHALIIVDLTETLCNPYYISYYLRSCIGKELLLLNKTGALLPHLNSGKIGVTIVTRPPLSEQHQIATYLDTKCSEIDSLISIKQKKIDELKDYKKSLIYEYVTGKKQVG